MEMKTINAAQGNDEFNGLYKVVKIMKTLATIKEVCNNETVRKFTYSKTNGIV